MSVYLDSYQIYAQLSGVWTDVTAWVIGDITAKWGIAGTGPLDRVAGTGEMRITLDNSTGLWVPDSPGAQAGWKKGVGIKLVATYDRETFVRFKGRVETISPAGGIYGHLRVNVLALDWMDLAGKHPIVNPGILTNQRGDAVITQVLAEMPIAPDGRELDTGVSVFPTTFDTVTSHTKALSEFGKVALSEPGFVYLRKDHDYGETLVFENAARRHGWQPYSPVRVLSASSGFLLKEDGGFLLKEDGGKIILDEAGTFQADNSMSDADVAYGEDVINRMTAYANPRKIDTSAQVLFRLNEPIQIASGATLELRGTYADPSGGLPINGQDMIDPVASTDYLMNTSQDGSGTNITSSLAIISTRYGTEGFVHTVQNESASFGWITQFNCRGYGIYKYNPIEHVESNDDSMDTYGVQTESVDMKYQTTLVTGTALSKEIVFFEHLPESRLRRLQFIANRSSALMQVFLDGDVGFMFRAKVDSKDVDTICHVQQMSFTIKPGGFIMFEWVVRTFLSFVLGLSPLAVEFRGGSTEDAIEFGPLPRVFSDDTPDTITLNLWIKPDTIQSQNPLTFSTDPSSVYGGIEVALGSTGKAGFISNMFGGNQGLWQTTDTPITANNWHMVTVVYDMSSPGNDPTIYVNGTLKTLTETLTPSGSAESRNGVPLIIGCKKTWSNFYTSKFDGRIKDVRIYNRLLSSGEVTTLYNSGTPDVSLVTDGLVFQAFGVPAKRYTSYVDATLTDSMPVIDNVFRAVGSAHDGPIGRAP